jgi:hypothetical protein
MTPDERAALAHAYIEHFSNPSVWSKEMVPARRDNSNTQWAVDKVFDITYENPEELLELVLEILHRDPPIDVIQVLAAGPLEDYLAKCGEKAIGHPPSLASAARHG